MNNGVLLGIAFVIFIRYVQTIWEVYGVQKSISESYYRLLEEDNKYLKYLFTFFCWGFAYPILIVAHTPLMYIATSLIMLVGASPAFKQDKLVKSLHMIGAYGGVGIAMISIWIDFYMWYLTIAFIVIAGNLFIFKVKNKIWWIEIIAFLTIVLTLILRNNG